MKIVKLFFFILTFYSFWVGAETITERDFDHQIQYSQKQLGENTYQVSVHRLGKVKFDHMSVFMVRHAFELCKHYGYQIEVLEGVELFDDRLKMPNKIFSSFIANIHCAKL